MHKKTLHKPGKKKIVKKRSRIIGVLFLLLLVAILGITLVQVQYKQVYQQQAASNTCGSPGDKGNEKGVGKYCTQGGGQCFGTGAPICSADIQLSGSGICSKSCNTDADCGTGATCFQDTLGKGCKPNICNDTPTAAPIPTKKPVPTALPTIKPAPTLRPTSIPVLQPTTALAPTTSSQATSLLLTVYLNGIGNSGDSRNPTINTLSNKNPLQTQRSFTISLTNNQNQSIATQTTNLTYNASGGFYTGTLSLANAIISGIYTVSVKTPSFLEKTIQGVHITAGRQVTIPAATLIAGDINDDGVVDTLDYTILIGCFSELLQPTACSAAQKQLADLNDDGKVDQTDYNLFLREIGAVQ